MLKFYNTLTRKKEIFKPIKNDLVSFYHCGPTVYWTQHIGNLRAMVMCDLIVRALEYLDYNVKLVRNYTDVGHLTSDEDEGDDKLEKGALRDKITPQEVADKYIEIFEDDIRMLNARPADFKPRATETIPEIIKLVQILLDKGYAYQTELAIYFDVSKFKNYTQLSGQNLNKNIAEAGKGEAGDANKKNPSDFALWFFKTGAHKNALQTWESPWGTPGQPTGQGFPGWHIECSAMAKKFLGETLDIHMGGIEHVPVHHTNEIAQSETANGVKFVNYWLHNEHLTVNGAKMAKSEGTVYSLGEITAKGYDPLVLRFFFLSAHYRSKQNFNFEALDAAATGLKKLQNKIIELKEIVELAKEKINETSVNEKYRGEFIKAVEDDANIPQALAVLWEMFKDDGLTANEALATAFNFDKVLGLKLAEIKAEPTAVPAEVQALLDNRQKFREAGDYAEADKIREEIEKMGYGLKDDATGAKIYKKY
jgi:cysteinyl-tRNA synthetase